MKVSPEELTVLVEYQGQIYAVSEKDTAMVDAIRMRLEADPGVVINPVPIVIMLGGKQLNFTIQGNRAWKPQK